MKTAKDIIFQWERKTIKSQAFVPAASSHINKEEIVKIDASGLSCPGPIMKLAENISKLNNGEILEITSTDKGFYSDVEG